MAISDSHFKTPENVHSAGASLDLPVEMIAAAGGGLLVFALVMLVVWKRMIRADQAEG